MGAGAVEVNITTNHTLKGAIFDGVDDYVELPHNANQLGANLSNGFTISAWINPRSAGEGTAGVILDKSNGHLGTGGFNFCVSPNTFKRVGFYLNDGTARVSATDSVLYGVWTHVLVTISSGQLANFYVNGVSSGTANQDLIQTISTITTTNAPRIGNRAANTDKTFDGGIGQVKMWNRVLNSTEIAQDYAGSPVTNGLILDVPLQSDYNDKSTTGLTGTNSGTHLAGMDDAISAAIEADRTTANDVYLMTGVKGGQVVSAVIEEAP